MAQELYNNIFMQSIPLPKNPLRVLNCYIIKSEERNLIIDTGFNLKACMDAMMEGITETGIDLEKTDLLITHNHTDHSGLAHAMSSMVDKIYIGKTDSVYLNAQATGGHWERLKKMTRLFGLEKDNMVLGSDQAKGFSPGGKVDLTLLSEGDTIEVGEYVFEVVDIPGHTPGHIGLYERNHKLFFCGDHILGKISPNISFWGFESDILAIFIESLKKVYEFDINHLFSAHGIPVLNYRKRITELIEHHEHRLEEILGIIKHEEKSVRDTAASMEWNTRDKGWAEMPTTQKWFASSETMAHLEHLFWMGKADRREQDGIIYYKAK